MTEPAAGAAGTSAVPDERRVAVVLGASGTIGTAVARRLAEDGWTVVAHGNRTAPTVGASTVCADLTDWDATLAMADEVVAAHGAPAALVNCAGSRDDGRSLPSPPSGGWAW